MISLSDPTVQTISVAGGLTDLCSIAVVGTNS